jgi:tetratricopeptide (TPR) repeat protein
VGLSNPFPGLRPFEADEDHLFFGREQEVDDLLRRLRTSRLIAVVGTSGSGKSSLVRSGLIPSLHSGFMASAGSSWRIAIMRPGEDPIGHLASALSAPQVLAGPADQPDTNRVLLEVTLRRSTLGLIDAVKHARLPAGENLLIIVDQFEELFRFRASRQSANRDEAINFVRILLAAAAQREQPIFIVLTMRSDFIGDCMNFPGLPEAVNAGLYLVGRMSRDGLRAAITGPVAVAGGAIAPRLVNRVLNDLGDDHDQLPLVQHALMRTWDHAASRPSDGPIDIDDYVAAGTFRQALSNHAEEAYQEAVERGLGEIAERIFKALTDTVTDQRGVRRPTAIGELAEIVEASEAQVIEVVDRFRAPGRSFLTPPARIALGSHSIVDISHESLMRCWARLIAWAEEERAAAAFYVRLLQAAAWYEQGSAGEWRNPELELAVRWKAENAPTRAWAERYGVGFDRAMRFLDRSVDQRAREADAIERERRTKLRRTQAVAGGLATLLIAAIGFGWFAWSERQRAQGNLALARQAVDESLAAIDRDPALAGADVPQVEELRRDLMTRAERFYLAFVQQEPRSDAARRDLAMAHLRVARISRMLEKLPDAEREYQAAIAGLTALAAAANAPADRQALGTAYNALGETLRVQSGRSAAAARAYEEALRVLAALVEEQPSVSQYQEDLALARVNRGILRWDGGNGPAAEADFGEAIRLLEAAGSERPRTVQELDRALNNLGAAREARADAAAETFYARAIDGHEALVRRVPENREYQLELAKFSNNLAVFLEQQGRRADAVARNRRATELLTRLARPAPSLAIELADTHNLRGMIVQAERRVEAERSFEESLDLFVDLSSVPALLRMPSFHQRFGDLLVNLALLAQIGPSQTDAAVLDRAIGAYLGVASRIADGGDAAQARAALDTINRVLPEVAQRDRQRVAAMQVRLGRVAASGPR